MLNTDLVNQSNNKMFMAYNFIDHKDVLPN